MPNTYSSAQHFVGQLSDNYRIGIQCGQSTGSSPEALAEMKWITFAEFKSYARQGLGNFANYRGPYSNALPEDAVQNDYFNATGTFTVGGVTYESGHVYEYNGSSWGDVTNVFSQFITLQQAIEAAQGQINELALLKTQLAQALGQDPEKVPSCKAVDDSMNLLTSAVAGVEERVTDIEQAVESGYKYKGDCTYANLPTSGQQLGDLWYVTDRNDNYVWNGSVWRAQNNVGWAWVLQTDGDYKLGLLEH